MNKGLKKNMTKSVLLTVAIIVSIVAFATIATTFMLYVYGQLNSVTDEYVEEITNRKTDYVNTLLENDMKLVQNLSSSLSDYENLDEKIIDSTLERITELYTYKTGRRSYFLQKRGYKRSQQSLFQDRFAGRGLYFQAYFQQSRQQHGKRHFRADIQRFEDRRRCGGTSQRERLFQRDKPCGTRS